METSTTSFKNKVLRRSTDQTEYNTYKAALEWDLTEPIVIESTEDIRSKSKWHERLEPFHHQITNLITFCRRLPVTLLADDVGLGKTISAGLIMSELISRNRVSKVLIVCPKLLIPQWKEELEVKFGIPAVGLIGKNLIKKDLPEETIAVITTYNSARLYLKELEEKGFEMLILDEAHKLRNLYGVSVTPQVALSFRKALHDRSFKYVLMLTATPIQNRLWDMYSLIDLLTVAKGHENPFGNEGMFAKKFINDNTTDARQLNPKMKEEFRNIVYGYMSRVRRADANLYFPERKVKLHDVDPTAEELQLLDLISEPIKKLNPLAQTSILQAFTSSPEALAKQLKNMATNESIPPSLANDVEEIVKKIKITSKLKGLGTLIDQLRKENPKGWRAVIFTERLETQTSIGAFLDERKIACGFIKGNASVRNQEAIESFKKDPPDINVIISTRAGSEGVNLQVANVLVNYDLPWNPMIVEQRIGRIQRLSSKHANVCIYNIILRNTFEHKIVGRLMEKLQLASHAVGDVEALLEASGMDKSENGSNGFEDMIRKLVLLSLEGKDVESATLKETQSIAEAKSKLELEEKNINSMLDSSGTEESGPRCPKLPEIVNSMDYQSFVLNALRNQDADLEEQTNGLYILEADGRQEFIRFDNKLDYEVNSTLYEPGAPAFDNLVKKVSITGRHQVDDEDKDTEIKTQDIAKNWAKEFGANFKSLKIENVWRCFSGKALLRVRATVAHDSYERLVEIPCSPNEHRNNLGEPGLVKINDFIENPISIGISAENLIEKALLDIGISEFCRFYRERMIEEVKGAGGDVRKRKKLEDDFTPRMEITLVGLEGTIHRELKVQVTYDFDNKNACRNHIVITPKIDKIIESPQLGNCEVTKREVPLICLEKCAISGLKVLRNLLVKSEISEKMALPQYMVKCALTGKVVLPDETGISAITGNSVINELLKTSAVSGKKAEPQFFTRCEFSNSELLENEISVSQISGKKYRIDEQLTSVISGKSGHKEEFVFCSLTNQPLLATETEKCEVTGKIVVPGILENCEISSKKVLPSELEKCTVTGKKALKKFFVSSSISEARMLEKEGIKSSTGKFCLPQEGTLCTWSGNLCHPDDVRICQLTTLTFHFAFIGMLKGVYFGENSFNTLLNLLNGNRQKEDKIDLWPNIALHAAKVKEKGSYQVEAAELSPDGNKLAICLKVKSWIGFKIRYAGFLYSIQDKTILGRFVVGKRKARSWILDN